MFDGIPWQAIGTILTPVGLYMLGFFMLMRGDLIPRKTHEREITARDEALHRWRKTSETKDVEITTLTETNRTLTETNRTLSHEVGQTVTKVMDELQQQARRGGDT